MYKCSDCKTEFREPYIHTFGYYGLSENRCPRCGCSDLIVLKEV